jgi:Homeodomain-like domain-containing protein
MTTVRALMGVGYYRSQTPDLALYLGDSCYPGLTEMYARIGFNEGTEQPYVDHSEKPFDNAQRVTIKPVFKDKPNTREAHLRGAGMFRRVWARLACPAKGFAKSTVVTEDHGDFVRSSVDNWRIEPSKGKRIIVPAFKHNDLTLAIVEGVHALHTLSDDDRAAIVAHFDQYRFDSTQIAAVLGCSPKTVSTWRRKSEAPKDDIDVKEVIKQALLDAVKWQESFAAANAQGTPEREAALAQVKAYRIVLRQRYGSDKTVLEAAMERANVVPITEIRRVK